MANYALGHPRRQRPGTPRSLALVSAAAGEVPHSFGLAGGTDPGEVAWRSPAVRSRPQPAGSPRAGLLAFGTQRVLDRGEVGGQRDGSGRQCAGPRGRSRSSRALRRFRTGGPPAVGRAVEDVVGNGPLFGGVAAVLGSNGFLEGHAMPRRPRRPTTGAHMRHCRPLWTGRPLHRSLLTAARGTPVAHTVPALPRLPRRTPCRPVLPGSALTFWHDPKR